MKQVWVALLIVLGGLAIAEPVWSNGDEGATTGCYLENAYNQSAQAKAIVNGTTVTVPINAEVWYASPTDRQRGQLDTLMPGAAISWQNPGTSATQSGSVTETPMIVMVK